MFGYLRFALAFFVLISHVHVRFFGLNPGVIAVVIFYILAGHVVVHLWEDVIPDGRGKLLKFYRDRILRIYPLYLYVAVLTLLFLSITGYGEPRFSPSGLIENFSIVPLNLYMVLDSTVLTTPSWCLIPPAWSLGAELQAYLLLPLVFLSKSLKIVLVAASLSVYMLANLSIIHPDYFGYRLLPGVFFMFVAGSSLRLARDTYDNNGLFDRCYPWVLWVSIAAMGLVSIQKGLFSPAYTKETYIGLLAGIPLVYILDRFPLKLRGNALAGALSYGVFLSHFFMIWWLDYTGFFINNRVVCVFAITLGSLAISFVGITFVERYVDTVRKN
ncbi:MAG: acyltransferase [Desulfobacteraceae bacterium]|nr:acyltransferase [Desulfobacteraceae bacterium]